MPVSARREQSAVYQLPMKPAQGVHHRVFSAEVRIARVGSCPFVKQERGNPLNLRNHVLVAEIFRHLQGRDPHALRLQQMADAAAEKAVLVVPPLFRRPGNVRLLRVVQQPLAAAMNVDGHVVTDKKVWTSKTSEFPLNSSSWKNSTDVIGTTNDLVSVFTNNRTEGAGITKTALNNGFVWKNAAFPAVELYDAVEMSAVQFSDGPDSQGKPQAYEIIGSNGLRVTDWVPPTAVIDPETGSPVPGYSGIGEVFDGTDWTILQQSAKANYAWAADFRSRIYPDDSCHGLYQSSVHRVQIHRFHA